MGNYTLKCKEREQNVSDFKEDVVKEASDIIRKLFYISSDTPNPSFIPVMASQTASGFVCFMTSQDGSEGFFVRKSRQFISCRAYNSMRFACKSMDPSTIVLSMASKKDYEQIESII